MNHYHIVQSLVQSLEIGHRPAMELTRFAFLLLPLSQCHLSFVLVQIFVVIRLWGSNSGVIIPVILWVVERPVLSQFNRTTVTVPIFLIYILFIIRWCIKIQFER